MKKHFIKMGYGALLGIIGAGVVWLAANYFADNIMTQYEARTYDWRIKKKIQDDFDRVIEEIVIIDIDGYAVSQLGKFSQWPHTHHARLIDNLNREGAKIIGFDVLFDKQIFNIHESDAFVEKVKSAGNVYNALYFGRADTMNWRYEMTEAPSVFNASNFYYNLSGPMQLNVLKEQRIENEFFELINASKGAGHVNFKADNDGVARSMHLFTKFIDRLYPSLPFKIYMDLVGADEIKMEGPGILGLYSSGENVASIPVDENGNMRITYHGSFQKFRYISYALALENQVDMGNLGSGKHYFKDKIFLIGTSLAGLFDLRNTPMLQAFPGVEIHANILKTLIDQDFIVRMSKINSFILIAIIGIIIGILVNYFKPLYSILLVLAASGIYVLSSMVAFDQNLWIDIVTPLLTIFATFSFVYIYRYATEESNKRFIRTTFSHFVTKSVVDELLANPDKIKLGGEKKICTVMFSDVAGFTSISEKLSPEALVALLNDYLTQMTNIVFQYDGMLDKYEGDAIMAVYGAPVSSGNDAFNACISALEMQEALKRMRIMLRKQGRDELYARIGLNTGPMVVGNMGSETRFDYTVMGDAVNLGARLEPACKQYGVDIMIGPNTYEAAKDQIFARQLDLLRVKGKNEPVKVYELVGTVEKGISENKKAAIQLFNKGFQLYLDQKWDEAKKMFESVLALDYSDGPSKRYVKRCSVYAENPPAADWDGVFTMTTK